MTPQEHAGPVGVPGAWVGNDVVDLKEPRVQGKAQDRRFLARVLAPTELVGLESSHDPHVELWCLWAAKEAAYKAICKDRDEQPVFAHSSFIARWSRFVEAPAPEGTPLRVGAVAFEGTRVPVVVHGDPDVIHAHGWLPAELSTPADISWGIDLLDSPGAEWDAPLGALAERLSPRERTAVHSVPSAAVRLAARRALAESMQVAEDRLEIVCDPGPLGRSPPRVYLDGIPAAADVSLSHAGRWLAWAHWVEPRLQVSPRAAGS